MKIVQNEICYSAHFLLNSSLDENCHCCSGLLSENGNMQESNNRIQDYVDVRLEVS